VWTLFFWSKSIGIEGLHNPHSHPWKNKTRFAAFIPGQIFCRFWTSSCTSDGRLLQYAVMLNVAVHKNKVYECNQIKNHVSLNISFAIK